MGIGPARTGSAQVRWAIEYFGYDEPYPIIGASASSPAGAAQQLAAGSAGSLGSLAASVASSSFAASATAGATLVFADELTTQVLQDLSKKVGFEYDDAIQVGVRNINISRAKNGPEGRCAFTIIGHVPDTVYNGGWVVMTSTVARKIEVDGEELVLGEPLIRFIGQIKDFNTLYDVQQGQNAGLVAVGTTFTVRDWSYALTMPLRYDALSVNQVLAGTALGIASNIASDSKTLKTIEQIIMKSTNCWEFAHVVLAMLGAISDNDKLNIVDELQAKKLPNVAVQPPRVPMKLLQRLGLPTADPEDPYETGFVKVITGVQKVPVCNDGLWDGIFGSDSSNKADVDEYGDSFYVPDNRPIMPNVTAMLGQGSSAWDLLTNHCEPSINDVYTDFMYERRDGVIYSRPTVFVRDKPYLMRTLMTPLQVSAPQADLDGWSKYDDIPRIQIDARFIVRLNVGQTIENSPNVFRVNFMNPSGGFQVAKSVAQYAGFDRLDSEAARHGGKEWYIQTQYTGTIKTGVALLQPSPEAWYITLKTVGKAWYGYNYRQGFGRMTLRDYNTPVTIGSNISFQIGSFTLVAHVEAISIVHQINEQGGRVTVTDITLDRIVKALPDGSLDFFTPAELRSLNVIDPEAGAAFGLEVPGLGGGFG